MFECQTGSVFAKITVLLRFINSLIHPQKPRNPNKEIYKFVLMVIDSFNKDINIGVPLGNQTSQCFALYYLDNFDRIIKEKYRIKYYTRYMDDGVIISDDKEKLKS